MKILVLNDLSLMGGRDIQRGIFEYIDQSNADWDLRVVPNMEASSLLGDVLSSPEAKVSGIILTEEFDPAVMDALTASAIPLAVIGLRHAKLERRTRAIAFVRNDNQAIGRLAAEHFLSLGKFNSYAFIPVRTARSRFWSDERQAGFVEALKKVGLAVNVPPDGADLVQWLSALPTPIAAFAAYDAVAAELSRLCRDANLAIPQKIALLGVDNDDFICPQCRPALSSILPGHQEMGFIAARELHGLIRKGAKAQQRRISVVPPRQIISRGSTRLLPPATALVRRMQDFIRLNATKGITVADVIRHVHVSRRLAELRFRELEGISLRQAIESRRLGIARRLLAKRNRTVAAVAAECGYSSGNRLTRAFKAHFGLSISAWQKGNKAE